MNVHEKLRLEYATHYGRMNNPAVSGQELRRAMKLYDWEVLPFLPQKKNEPVVEIGSGYGLLVEYLLDRGFTDISAVDICSDLLECVRNRLAKRLTGAHCCDGTVFLDRYAEHFGLIIMFDVIEHLTLDDCLALLTTARKALSPEGILLLRTPNMANIMANYARYDDITHKHGYTDQSLEVLLRVAGFSKIRVRNRTKRRTWRGQLAQYFNAAIHRLLLKIESRRPPRTFAANIIMSASVQ
jgi:2-polyprenyl-3-methyl-5-hydroxy-6-metoxy-1,4-benzoquinol methylase